MVSSEKCDLFEIFRPQGPIRKILERIFQQMCDFSSFSGPFSLIAQYEREDEREQLLMMMDGSDEQTAAFPAMTAEEVVRGVVSLSLSLSQTYYGRTFNVV